MAAGDLAQTLALAAFAVDCPTVDREGLPTDVTAFELGSPHAGSHALDDQVAFEFGDRTDDHDDGPAQRAGRVDAFAEADELDVEPVELVQDLEEDAGWIVRCDRRPRPGSHRTYRGGHPASCRRALAGAPSRR